MLLTEKYDLSTTVWNGLIDEWIHHERNRAIIRRRLLDAIPYERLAEEYDLSTQQVKAICLQAKNQLEKHLKTE